MPPLKWHGKNLWKPNGKKCSVYMKGLIVGKLFKYHHADTWLLLWTVESTWCKFCSILIIWKGNHNKAVFDIIRHSETTTTQVEKRGVFLNSFVEKQREMGHPALNWLVFSTAYYNSCHVLFTWHPLTSSCSTFSTSAEPISKCIAPSNINKMKFDDFKWDIKR